METSFGTRRSSRRRRSARLVAAVLPLPALLAPASAQASASISICSAEGARVISIPTRDGLPPRPEDQQACAHFTCPRERALGDPTDDDEE